MYIYKNVRAFSILFLFIQDKTTSNSFLLDLPIKKIISISFILPEFTTRLADLATGRVVHVAYTGNRKLSRIAIASRVIFMEGRPPLPHIFQKLAKIYARA